VADLDKPPLEFHRSHGDRGVPLDQINQQTMPSLNACCHTNRLGEWELCMNFVATIWAEARRLRGNLGGLRG